MCLHISTCISSVPCKSKMDMRSTHGEDVPRCILQAACVARMKGKHSGGCMSKKHAAPFLRLQTEAGRDGWRHPARLLRVFCGVLWPRGYGHSVLRIAMR